LSKQVSSYVRRGIVNYLAVLKAVKEIVEIEERMEDFFVRPERQKEILDLVTSLNEAKPPVTRKDRQRDNAVDVFTKSLSVLTQPLAAAASKIEAATVLIMSSGRDPALDRRLWRLLEPFICFFCEEPGHTKLRCPHLSRLSRTRSVHLNRDGRVCLGPFGKEIIPIRRIPGLTLLQTVER
jgi:hypothetical protein